MAGVFVDFQDNYQFHVVLLFYYVELISNMVERELQPMRHHRPGMQTEKFSIKFFFNT